jgi:membrane associated rhomboid family serine protease
MRNCHLRVNGKGSPLQRPFTGGSILWNGLARPRLRGLETGRYAQATVRQTYNFAPNPPPRYRPRIPGSSVVATIVVGGIVLSCISATAWDEHMKAELGSKRSRQWLSDFRNTWVLSPRNIREGRWYTLITSTFMHNGFWHLGFNMMALWSFGTLFARGFGVTRFTLLYFGSGIVGGLIQNWYWERTLPPGSDAAAVGASGCISGMLGAMTFAAPRSNVLLLFVRMPIWQSSLFAVMFSGMCIQTSALPWIGHVDHLGGMSFGAIFCK